jgi:hypothetical protein
MTFGAIEISKSRQQGLDTLSNSFSDSVSRDTESPVSAPRHATHSLELRSRGNRPTLATRAATGSARGRLGPSAVRWDAARASPRAPSRDVRRGPMAETLHDVIAAQSRAVVPARSGSDVAPRPDLAMLSYLRALEHCCATAQRTGDRRRPRPRLAPAAARHPLPPTGPDRMPSIKQTFHRLQEQRRRRRATLPWAELEAEAARQGCAAADIFFDRAGRPVPGLPTLSDAAAARDRDFAPTPRETPVRDQVKPTYDTWGRRA